MNQLKVGFGRANITPPMGIEVSGYFVKRKAEGVLDELEANAVAICDGKTTALLVSLDLLGFMNGCCPKFVEAISKKTGLPKQSIFLHCTHTHTGPTLLTDNGEEVERQLACDNLEFLISRSVDVANFALNDLKPAKMGYGVAKAPNIAFIRRYRMKDGSVKTNPGVLNPDILHPAGQRT